MAKIDEELRAHLGRQLRRVFRYSPVKRAAKALFKSCEVCGEEGKIEIDHTIPVVPVDKEIGALEYFKRMFCLDERGNVDLVNLIGLCAVHHRAKSKAEMGLRAKYKTGPYSREARAKISRKREKVKIRLGRGKKKHVSSRRKKTKK